MAANEPGILYKWKTKRIIPYVMTWDEVMINYRNKYIKQLESRNTIKSYMKSKYLRRQPRPHSLSISEEPNKKHASHQAIDKV